MRRALADDLAAMDEQIMAAHAQHDFPALVHLYTCAADAAELADQQDAAAFYLTHAFVFALEAGASEAAALNKRLADIGRADLLEF
ncbi:MAG: hypothetical protein AAF141_06355 [Pseudomonadota bacterium]